MADMSLERMRYSADNCSIARTLEIVGEKWTLLILRESFYGLKRFEELQTAVGCARNVLSARLAKLVDEGLLARKPYREPGSRERQEYQLTEKGIDLFPALVALLQWGDRWASDPAGPSVELRHRDCGEPVEAQLTCGAGHEHLGARDTYPTPGPGAKLAA
jgi:DNA-binding HxlR family transcriptional regulator